MRRLSPLLRILLLTAIFALAVGIATPVLAQTSDQFGLDQAGFGVLQRPDPGAGLTEFIVRIVQWILGFLAIVVVLIIIYAGFIWMTAGGNPDRVARAKKILINALIGLAIILFSYAIVTIIFGLFGHGTGRPRPPCPTCENYRPRSGIGVGPIQSVYPEPNQTEVPINTWIAVTFKEEVDPSTICESDANADGDDVVCDGEPMRNVDICGYDPNGIGFCIRDVDGTPDPANFSLDEFAGTLVRQTADNRTFVFSPNKYLGFEDFKDREFYVHLKSGIKAKAADESIFANWGGGEYGWVFTTNGEVDLDPPEVVSTNTVLNPPGVQSVSGVFPNPDNAKDLYRVGSAAQPRAFTVSATLAQIGFESQPSYTQPVTSSASTLYGARVGGTYGGERSGVVGVSINSSNGNVQTDWPTGMTDYTASEPHDGRNQVLDIGPQGLTFTVTDGVPARGNQWSFTVTAGQVGDHLIVRDGSQVLKDYTFGRDIPATTTASGLTRSIRDTLARDLPSVFMPCAVTETCTVKTVGAGAQWNRYALLYVPRSPQASPALTIASTTGQDASDIATPIGEPDVARNAIFQITFNEPVNPISLASALSVRYGKAASDTTTLEPVNFQVPEFSNRYRTVELRGTEPCGQNACGVERFCWPVNDALKANPADYANKATRYEVEVTAPALQTCTGSAVSDAWCTTWGGTCETSGSGRCVKVVGTDRVYHPTTLITSNGINDMSGNAFNGSFNYYIDAERDNRVVGMAEGKSATPTSAGGSNRPAKWLNSISGYTPSTPSAEAGTGFGDTFAWSFWLSDRVDDQSPLLMSVDPVAGTSVRNMLDQIKLNFNKVMRSSTLKPGWNYGSDAMTRSVRYVVLQTVTNWANPVGYWVGTEQQDDDADGFPERTTALVDHNRFDVAVQYGPQAGSGIEDIYQNCFMPGAGPQLGGATVCRYQAGSDDTIGCVTDANLPSGASQHSRIVDTNPSSYATLMCAQIEGANECAISDECKALYATTTSATAPALDGSWVVTKDFPWYDLRPAEGEEDEAARGCCLGVCGTDID